MDIMVLDSLPEVQRLPSERRLELAAEIIEQATKGDGNAPDPEIVAASTNATKTTKTTRTT